MNLLTNPNESVRQTSGTNYWRRTQFLLGGIYALILFSSVIFLLVRFAAP